MIKLTDSKDIIDITNILDTFEVDYTTEEELGRDKMYRKLITSVYDAIKFNYQSDYWGDADEYQDANVGLIEALERLIGDRVKLTFDDGTVLGTLEGILIDKQYNSLGHTRILLSDIVETEDK
jgi:hypothetical protein